MQYPITVEPPTNPSCGCGQYTTSTNCINDPQARCQWCDQCSGAKYSGAGSRCVNKGTCTYTCNKNYCGAQCDSSVTNCDINTCTLGCVTETQTCTGSSGSTGNCCQTTASHCDYGLDEELSQGYCCPDGEYYSISDRVCLPRDPCPDCLYEPSQLEYTQTITQCVNPNPRTSCCLTTYGGGGSKKYHIHYQCKYQGTDNWVNC